MHNFHPESAFELLGKNDDNKEDQELGRNMTNVLRIKGIKMFGLLQCH